MLRGCRLALYGFLLLCLVVAILLCAWNASRGNDEVTEVFLKIKTCPAWSEIGWRDAAAKKRILAALHEIGEHDLDTIREAMAKYIRMTELPLRGRAGTEKWSRLYVLNKYLFALPRRATLGEHPFFGGWTGVPTTPEEVNLQWPFSYTAKGTLSLVGDFQGYMGPPYFALEAFDYYRTEFGRRNIRKE